MKNDIPLIDLGTFSHEPSVSSREKRRLVSGAEQVFIRTVLESSVFELKRSPNLAISIFNHLVEITTPNILVQSPVPIAQFEIGSPHVAEFETSIREQKTSSIARTLSIALLGLGQDIPIIHSNIHQPVAWRAKQSKDKPDALLEISFGIPSNGHINFVNRAGYSIQIHDIKPALPPNILYNYTQSG